MNQSVSTLTGKTKIKIVFLGNQSVGKSSVIQQYIHNRFDNTSHPTVGIDFLAKNIMHKNKNYRLQLWDTAGQQRFRSLIPSYLKDSQCALILFDVTCRQNFNSIEEWIKMYNENKTKGMILMVGNKIDLQRDREVSTEQGIQKAKQLGILYSEISAKTGQNLETLFLNVIQVCMDPNFNTDKYSFKGQVDSDKIEEVEQKNEEDKERQPKNMATKPNFAKNKQKPLQSKQGKKQAQTPSKDKENKEMKIKRTDSTIVETSQQKQNKVIRLEQKKQKPKTGKGGCC